MEEIKVCSTCHTPKTTEEFSKNKQTSDGLMYMCKVCDSVRATKWRSENPVKRQEYALTYEYGKGAVEHLAERIKEQGSCCAICDKPFVKTPCLDHNHETGQLRGALCNTCNGILGWVENSERMNKANAYLSFWKEKNCEGKVLGAAV